MNPPSLLSIPKPTFACIRCSERKVKCDKQSPCSACVRHNAQCIFRPPKTSQRKRKPVQDKLLQERLKHYEALLRDKGIDLSQALSTSESEHAESGSHSEAPEVVWPMPTPASTVSEPQGTVFRPQLLYGQRGTKLLDNNLWSRVAEEIHDAEDALDEDSESDASDSETLNDDFAYVLGWKTPIPASPHPPAKVIHRLWQIFLENVNPLTKLVHVPTLQTAIEKAITNIEHIPRGFEALMFAIYSMAVLSLTESECKETFGESRAILLPHYVTATKAALSRARFMSGTSIVVLQALVLHILSIRDTYEPRAVWSLTGVAIRVAEGMGMHLDGTLLGLSPFETEIRRRIWWQLRMHDFRAAELSGQAKFRDFEVDETTPKRPANVDDSDLHPSMSQAAAESAKPTEMLWCMLRSDLATFAAAQKAKVQKLGKAVFASEEYAAMDDLKIKDGFIQEMEDMLETKYLRFCDPSQPLHLMTLLAGRCSINLVQFIAHHPRRWAKLDHVSTSEQQLVWSVVIQILERYSIMQSSPQLRCFAWNVPYFIQWHAAIHVLDTLRANPLHPDAVKAWRLIDALYENNSELLLGTKKPIFVAVGNLCLKAFSARAAALTKANKSVPDPPEYITKLREQRDEAKARRKVIPPQGSGLETHDGKETSTTIATDATRPNLDWRSAEGLIAAQPPATAVQGSTWTGDDAFWLSEALDDEYFAGGAAADVMNLDPDVILTQDCWLDTPDNEVIDWAQWDAWLGVDATRPNIGAGPE